MPVVNYWPEVGIERISFLKERSRNLFENKGSPWKPSEASGNVYENTRYLAQSSYGMLLKIKLVNTSKPHALGNSQFDPLKRNVLLLRSLFCGVYLTP